MGAQQSEVPPHRRASCPRPRADSGDGTATPSERSRSRGGWRLCGLVLGALALPLVAGLLVRSCAADRAEDVWRILPERRPAPRPPERITWTVESVIPCPGRAPTLRVAIAAHPTGEPLGTSFVDLAHTSDTLFLVQFADVRGLETRHTEYRLPAGSRLGATVGWTGVADRIGD